MKTYKAFATLPNIGQTPVTIEARSTYEAKEKLEAHVWQRQRHQSIRGVAHERTTTPRVPHRLRLLG